MRRRSVASRLTTGLPHRAHAASSLGTASRLCSQPWGAGSIVSAVLRPASARNSRPSWRPGAIGSSTTPRSRRARGSRAGGGEARPHAHARRIRPGPGAPGTAPTQGSDHGSVRAGARSHRRRRSTHRSRGHRRRHDDRCPRLAKELMNLMIRNASLACTVASIFTGAWLLYACGAAQPAPAMAPPPDAVSASSSPTASAPPEGSASDEPPQSAPDPAPAETPAPTASKEGPPPTCIGGQIIMGACICESGQAVDETGHCVDVPCPSTHGGVTFRDPKTHECMECRPGTKPTKDGHCEP